MKQTLASVLLCFGFYAILNAQAPIDITVQVNTTIYTGPNKIRFDWGNITGADSMKVYKKQKSASTWNLISSMPATATFFVDSPFVSGTDMEYKIYKDSVSGSVDGNTYIYTGIDVPPVEYRGKIIVIIDSTFINSLVSEINLLEQDLIGDGWQVIKHYVGRTASVVNIKRMIWNDYDADPINVKSVLLLGHVPVPYSGNIFPDGHPDHKGAWPADVYYADMDTISWTDATINTTSATRSQNHNIPGDGKFDQDSIPGPNNVIELQIGRIDLSNLTSFTQTEQQLLSQYLIRDHNYRHKNFNARRKGLIDDPFFGWWYGGAFSSCGWRNFSALFGKDNIDTSAYFPTLDTASYLWSYACGPGTYTSCGYIGNTDSFTIHQPKSVFNMLLGSYYGDWDTQNNFMRASLAANGWSLASIWTGIPYLHFHHMGMGDNIGYSTMVSQNDHSKYVYLESATGVHVALMGDPSLRLHTIAPPINVVTTPDFNTFNVNINWTASAEPVLGYHIYRLDTVTGKYNRINASIVATTNYLDNAPVEGNNYYMVRAVKLENGSGTYYNLSQGAFDTTYIQDYSGINDFYVINQFKIYPNPAQNHISVQFEYASGNNNEQATIVIYDAIGKIVFTQPLALHVGKNSKNITIESLPSGVYNCTIETANHHKQAERLVIMR